MRFVVLNAIGAGELVELDPALFADVAARALEPA
jgi:hypothetical protein